MTVELTQSSRSKLVTTVATVLRSLVEIGAAIKNSFGMSHPASAGKRTESLLETESVAIPEIRAQVEVEAHAEINAVARDELDQQEIERRRNLVRKGLRRGRAAPRMMPASRRPRSKNH